MSITLTNSGLDELIVNKFLNIAANLGPVLVDVLVSKFVSVSCKAAYVLSHQIT